MSSHKRLLYAVLIYADNVPAKFPEPVLKEIASIGEPAVRRAYCDWSAPRLRDWARTVREHRPVAHQETANTKGKKASDIGLFIDAKDILYTGHSDGFVLVSSDSDFTALANRVREQGLDVIGIGESKTPESLRNVCNRFILIENLVKETTPMKTAKAQDGGKQPATKAVLLIIASMEAIEQDDEWYALGPLGSRIMAAKPDFDTRSYAHRKLSDLMKSLNVFETRREGTHLFIRRKA